MVPHLNSGTTGGALSVRFLIDSGRKSSCFQARRFIFVWHDASPPGTKGRPFRKLDQKYLPLLLEVNGCARLLIHMEAKYIGTCIVANDIEVKFAPCQVTKIQFVDQQRVFIE